MIALLVWGIIGAIAFVGIRRIPLYYKRVDEHNAREFPYSHKDTGMKGAAAWGAVGLAVIWPLYELVRLIQARVIHASTSEARKEAEYEQARKIVVEHLRKKEAVEPKRHYLEMDPEVASNQIVIASYWEVIPGFEHLDGVYEINPFGDVRSYKDRKQVHSVQIDGDRWYTLLFDDIMIKVSRTELLKRTYNP